MADSALFIIKTIDLTYYKHPTDKESIPWTFWGLFLPGGRLWGYYNDRDHMEVFRDDNWYPPTHEMFIANVTNKWKSFNDPISSSHVSRFIRRGEASYSKHMNKYRDLVEQTRKEITEFVKIADIDTLLQMRSFFEVK